MENKEKIEIPFGARDSELGCFEYTIPEGYEAEIKDGKVIVRKLESEDERIRKELIEFFTFEHWGGEAPFSAESARERIAWLEKQGEQKLEKCMYSKDNYTDEDRKLLCDGCDKICKLKQKHADKVEPKFKVGDWIINSFGTLRHIINVDRGGYQTDGGWLSHDTYEKIFHLWTIQDAKDGDVLVVTMYSEGTWIGIFKEQNGCTFSSYCFLNTKGTFKLGKYNHGNGKAIQPATKEQRDLLFQKMKEAGYEWDAERKELKKIEQKPAWSEEDDNRINRLIAYFEDKESFTAEDDIVYATWLKSLKNRVQPQPKHEVDEQIETIATHLDNCGNTAMAEILRSCNLRPQKQWKPSEYQMRALLYALRSFRAQGDINYSGQLSCLYDQLKAL